MFIATVSSPKLELVREQPVMSETPDKQPHASRLAPTLKGDALGIGLMTMDKDNHLRLSWKGWIVLIAGAALLVGSNWFTRTWSWDEGRSVGITVGREQRDKEYILESIKQLNNIKTAQQMFPDQAPQQQEKK